jgi:molybdenum cofactor biosynthesis enzyme MoaA
LLDNHHRFIHYLRLSITDRFNLQYVYCEILTYQEANHGLTKPQPRKCTRPMNRIGGS